jgi:hypothetical protein
VVYQRSELDTDDHEPPETTVPDPDEALTPLDGCSADEDEDCEGCEDDADDGVEEVEVAV